jgi:hypothetical protein
MEGKSLELQDQQGEFLKNNWAVVELEDYLPGFKDKYRIVLSYIEGLPSDTPIEERLRLYERETNKLKNEFRKLRSNEYKGKVITLSKTHSCTSSRSGRVKDCGYKYINAPVGGYSRREWVSVTGTNKGISFTPTRVGLKMTKAGKGRNSGTLHVTFRYEPRYIFQEVEIDVLELFKLIIDPNKSDDEMTEINAFYFDADK